MPSADSAPPSLVLLIPSTHGSQLIKIRHGAMVHFCIKHQGCQTIQQYRNMIKYRHIEYTINSCIYIYTYIYIYAMYTHMNFQSKLQMILCFFPSLAVNPIFCAAFDLSRWKSTVQINLEGDTQKILLGSAYIAFHSQIESNRTSWSAVKVVAFPFEIPLRWQKKSEKVARSNEDLQPWQTHFLFSAHYIIPAKMNKTYFIYVYNTYMIHIGVAFIYIGTCRIYRLDICIDMTY